MMMLKKLKMMNGGYNRFILQTVLVVASRLCHSLHRSEHYSSLGYRSKKKPLKSGNVLKIFW